MEGVQAEGVAPCQSWGGCRRAPSANGSSSWTPPYPDVDRHAQKQSPRRHASSCEPQRSLWISERLLVPAGPWAAAPSKDHQHPCTDAICRSIWMPPCSIYQACHWLLALSKVSIQHCHPSNDTPAAVTALNKVLGTWQSLVVFCWCSNGTIRRLRSQADVHFGKGVISKACRLCPGEWNPV